MRREASKINYRQLEPEFASGMRRLSALVIDMALVVALLIPTLLLPLSRVGVPPLGLGLIALIMITLLLALFETKYGQTPGKYFLGIRVVMHSGAPLDLRTALVRNVMRIYDVGVIMNLWYFITIFDALIGRPLPGCLSGALRYVWSEKSQRWGDELAGTYVIRGQWKPVRFGSRDPASSIKDAINRSRVQYKSGSPDDI